MQGKGKIERKGGKSRTRAMTINGIEMEKRMKQEREKKRDDGKGRN